MTMDGLFLFTWLLMVNYFPSYWLRQDYITVNYTKGN